MYVLPLIELKEGESVHVLDTPSQGETRPIIDPVEVAHRFAALGAQGFHVVDVDHALSEKRDNDKALLSILDHTVLPVEAGGGVRSLKRIQELVDTGVRRVLVGTMGVLHQDWLKEAALIFRDQLVVCVDVQGDQLLVKGRTETAPATVEAFLKQVDGYGLESIHVAHMGSNGDGIRWMEARARQLKTPLTYQGPIEDEQALARLEQSGVRGVVLGTEIYDGRLAFDALAKRYRVR